MRLGIRKLSLPGLAAVLGAIALLAAGCGSSTPTGPTNLAKSQVFNEIFSTGGSADITTFDPTQDGDTASSNPINLVFEGLITLDQNLAVEKWEAKSFDVSSDGLTYTFHLRDGLKFSNGKAVTAADFAYSINRAANPCVASGVANYVTLLKDGATFNGETCTNGTITAADGQTSPVIQTLIGDSIIATDPKTLKLVLETPAAFFLEDMSYPTFYAIDQTVVGSDITSEKWTDTLSQGPTGQGGSGMFYVSKWDHSTIIQLKANPNWWGLSAGKKPFLKEIDLNFFKSGDTAYAAYQAGQYDYGNPTVALIAQAKTQADYHEYSTLTYFGINFQEKASASNPFSNVDARIALCLAVNRDQLNTSILKGADVPITGIVPKGMPGFNPNATLPDGVKATTGDATKAQSHWAAYKASLNGAAVPPLTYLYVSSSTSQKNLANALVAQWNQVLGITVTPTGEDFTTYLHDSNTGNYQISRFGWAADYPDPQDFLTLLFSTGAIYNQQNASVPAADTLMHAADANTNNTQRIQQYNQAEQLLIDNVATCPLYQAVARYQVRSYVHGYTEDAQTFTPLDSFVDMYITNH
jgi:peptide/nickel transport system substrate-binding protein/oligopeptide transport system substrate-binding protein